MTSDSNKNLSPATGIDSSLQAKKRVRYVLPKGCVIGGSYCIEKPLGHGGMGEVYLARHMKLDIYRAIKILLPKIAVKNPMFATRFMREAKLAIQLQHPNIINVMDADYDERLSIYYIVMEYVDGGTVRNLIRKNGPMSEREVLKIVYAVGEALAVGEERKIVHRDIKPDNIMLTKDNVVKLADLGIAKSTSDSNDVDVTSPEILIGTPAYVSPEQARDAQHVDSRADIYSLGVSMYEMLAGEKPYKGKTTVEILQQLFEASVPEVRQKNPAVSRKVSDLVYRMMAKEREKRPRNWKIFCREVARLLDGDTPFSGNETAATSVDDIKDIMPVNKGIVLGHDENRPLIDKKKAQKAIKYSGIALAGFVFCLLLVSGVLVFSSSALKQAWIDQNKPVENVQSDDIIINPDPTPTPAPVQYGGQGTLDFRINAAAEVEDWLKKKGYKLQVSSSGLASEIDVALPGELTVTSGKYHLNMRIPECKEFPPVDVEVSPDSRRVVNVVVHPMDATVKINCNVPGFQVWWNNAWQNTDKLQVESLRTVNIVVGAKGYRQFTSSVKLQPGEVKLISADLIPRKKHSGNADVMKQADEEFKRERYSTAKKLYEQEAANDNPQAMYKLGEIFDQGYGMWNGEKGEALKYYTQAAGLDHPEAIYKVGEFYENGMGNAPLDKAAALSWYRRGAEVDHQPSIVKVGLFHENGFAGLERSPDTALEYYLRSAEKGSAEAQYRAAAIYVQKMLRASTQNQRDEYKRKAKQFYEKAAQQNWRDARSRLRML